MLRQWATGRKVAGSSSFGVILALGSNQLCHIGELVVSLGVMRPQLRAINITTGDFLGFNQVLRSGQPVKFYKGHTFVILVLSSYFAFITYFVVVIN